MRCAIPRTTVSEPLERNEPEWRALAPGLIACFAARDVTITDFAPKAAAAHAA